MMSVYWNSGVLRCLMELPWICSDAAESQAALGQSLAGLEGDIATLLLKIQSITPTSVIVRRIESQR